jgi:hypothetical protein
MDENRLDRARTGPPDDLSTALRRAVEEIVRNPPPEDVTNRALAAARQIGVRRPEAEGPALRRRPRVAWRVLAVAASIGLVAVLVWGRRGAPPDAEVVKAGPPAQQRIDAPPGDRLPTLWAYRQAAGQSAEALDAMLDRDARWVLRPEPQPFQAGASLGSIRQTL